MEEVVEDNIHLGHYQSTLSSPLIGLTNLRTFPHLGLNFHQNILGLEVLMVLL